MRFLLLAAALPLMACSFHSGDDDSPGIAGSGSGDQRTYQVADFSGVEAAGADDVDVRVGTGFSVRAEGDASELDNLKIEKNGDTLSIGRRGHGFHWGNHKGVKVYVTMPRIASASIAGSGDMTIDHVEGDSFKGEVLVQRHTSSPDANPLFGGPSPVGVGVSGTITDKGGVMSGTALVGKASQIFSATLRKLADTD